MSNIWRSGIALTAAAAFACAAWAKDEDRATRSEPLAKVLARQAAVMGENILKVSESAENLPANAPPPIPVTPQDAEEVSKQCPAVRYVSPGVTVPANLKFEGREAGAISGVESAYFSIYDLKIAQGLAISDADLRAANKVCVIGAATAKRLFGQDEAVGKTVSLVWTYPEDRKPSEFRVIGVLEEKGPVLGGGDRWNRIVLIPWTTARQAANDGRGGDLGWGISAKAASREKVPEAIKQITELMRKRHNIKAGQPDDFVVVDQNKVIDDLVKRAIRIHDELPRNGKDEEIRR